MPPVRIQPSDGFPRPPPQLATLNCGRTSSGPARSSSAEPTRRLPARTVESVALVGEPSNTIRYCNMYGTDAVLGLGPIRADHCGLWHVKSTFRAHTCSRPTLVRHQHDAASPRGTHLRTVWAEYIATSSAIRTTPRLGAASPSGGRWAGTNPLTTPGCGARRVAERPMPSRTRMATMLLCGSGAARRVDAGGCLDAVACSDRIRRAAADAAEVERDVDAGPHRSHRPERP